jgi:hypothetical protein
LLFDIFDNFCCFLLCERLFAVFVFKAIKRHQFCRRSELSHELICFIQLHPRRFIPNRPASFALTRSPQDHMIQLLLRFPYLNADAEEYNTHTAEGHRPYPSNF